MKKKVNYAVPLEPARQRGYPDKSSKSKVSSKSELCKVKQDNNLSSTHNASSDKDSHGKHMSLSDEALWVEDKLLSCFTLQSSDLLETLDFEDLSGYPRCPAGSKGTA